MSAKEETSRPEYGRLWQIPPNYDARIADALEALVEQQRIANAQFERAMLWQRTGRRVGADGERAAYEAAVLDAQIRAALGIGGEDAATS